MKKFIAALVVFVVIGAGWWLYQEQRTKDFKETALSIYKPYKVLVDDGNNLAKNMSGRNYDNLFRELGDIKQKNQDLKMKASSLIPPTDAAKAVHKQLIATLQAHDEGISGIIALIEANRYMTINDFDKNSDRYKESLSQYKSLAEKQNVAANKSRQERRALQAVLGIDVEPDSSTPIKP